MCGRFVSASSADSIAEYFGAAFGGEALGENYNVAPTNDIYGVVADPDGSLQLPDGSLQLPDGSLQLPDGSLQLKVFHWGLIPSWAKERKIGSRMINARSETLAEKPAFKSAFRKHRCLIPMDGFYEWKAATPDGPVTAKGKPAKQPMFIHSENGEPLAVAGLWSAWREPEANSGEGGHDRDHWLHSATIVTTSANSTMRPVHDRMPVILPKSLWAEWLDPGMHDLDRLSQLLLPAADDLLVLHPVSTDVNNVRNKGRELTAPVDPTL